MNYPVSGDSFKLIITLYNGDLTLIGEDRSDILVDFDDVSKQSIEKYIEMSEEENSIKIKERKKLPFDFFSDTEQAIKVGKRPAFDLDIKVPKELLLTGKIELYSGDMSISNINSDLTLKLYAGDIEITDSTLGADNIFKILSGDMKIKNCTGNFNAKLNSGDIKMIDSTIKDIHLNALSGDLGIQGDFELEKDGKITSLSGDIDIVAENNPEDLIVTNDRKIVTEDNKKVISIKSMAGSIDVKGCEYRESDRKFPFHGSPNPMPKMPKIPQMPHGHKIHCKVGKKHKGREDDIMDLTFSNIGDIIKDKVFKALKENREEAEFEKPEISTDSSIEKILEMLGDGKINADEAEKLIQSL